MSVEGTVGGDAMRCGGGMSIHAFLDSLFFFGRA